MQSSLIYATILIFADMRLYMFLRVRYRTDITRYLCNHCVILDNRTGMCYHSTRRTGYTCEHLDDMLKNYELMGGFEFESKENIEEYFYDYQERNGAYNLIDNNCEDFANGFIGYHESRQTDGYLLGAMAAATMFYVLLTK